MFLNRLEYVRQKGDSYRARCPVHGGDSRDSLSIREADDGKILIHCHAHQCPPLEIVNVCGLEMTDLFPERITHHATPKQKRQWHIAATRREVEASRKVILHESRVAWVAGKQIRAGEPLNDTDDARLDQALEVMEMEGRRLNGNP